MATVRPSVAARNAQLNAIRDLIDAGGGGRIMIFSGRQPATGDDTTSGNALLAVLAFPANSAGNASGGVLTFNAIEDAVAQASGTAVFARITNGNGSPVIDIDVGTSRASINLNTTAIVAGGVVRITSGTLTAPAK